MRFEIRHQGRRVEAFDTEAQAVAWTAAPERGNGWTVTPEKPFRVSCRGTLVETFDTMDEAESFVSQRLSAPSRFFQRTTLGPHATPWRIEN
ncbi:MAG TPA: hypothetical protein VJY33_19450 [Isosphaeraceae bacterium]|nr:hypothetical protein [Isosphaeraceae bacterium]